MNIPNRASWNHCKRSWAGATFCAIGQHLYGRRESVSVYKRFAAGLGYQIGSSLGTGPIEVDTRRIGLSTDTLLWMSLSGSFPSIFKDYAGAVGSNGQALATISLPDIPALVGIKIHSAFVTLHSQAPSGIRSISNTFSFTITK